MEPSSTRRPSHTRRVIVRYVLFQVPGTVLLGVALVAASRMWDLPAWLALLILGLWMLKDALLFPFVRKAYEPHGTELPGPEAVVTDALAPEGYVRVGGELWRARLRRGEAPPGTRVRVTDIRGLTLVVETDAPDDPPSG